MCRYKGVQSKVNLSNTVESVHIQQVNAVCKAVTQQPRSGNELNNLVLYSRKNLAVGSLKQYPPEGQGE